MRALSGPTWIVGCGNMAGAMVAGWRRAGVDLGNAIAIRPSGRAVDGVATLAHLPAGPPPAIALLGFKPQKLDDIAAELAPRLGPGTILLSILAGVEAASLRRRFADVGAIVRVMPNLPVSEGRGIIGLYSGDLAEEMRAPLTELFAALGRAHWAADEAELAAIGALAGAGPAYVARFIAALAAAGEERGLAPGLAMAVALETVAGTALMAEARGEGMADIARRVASPRGTTEAGLAILDSDQALNRLIARTIDAAARRGAQLAEEARLP